MLTVSVDNVYCCVNQLYTFVVSLALLDYVSRAHEIEIRPSVRPSVASIICEVIAWISFKF